MSRYPWIICFSSVRFLCLYFFGCAYAQKFDKSDDLLMTFTVSHVVVL